MLTGRSDNCVSTTPRETYYWCRALQRAIKVLTFLANYNWNAPVIDHTGVVVSDFEKSKAFYNAALSPIGYSLIMEFPASVTGATDVAGYGEPPAPDFWISKGSPNDPPVYVAFRVSTREEVEAFYRVADEP
jgi:hypothetical protein